ncbi:MAG: hypothetical protein E3J90_04435 [Promethearchaeota archaeon]|nr:MAG: hypothetical protein E3J90_04435 [Candidatus Lokiarchaeota archaeon]
MGDSREDILIKELGGIVSRLDSVRRDYGLVSDPALAAQLIAKAKHIILEFDGEDSKFIKDIEIKRNKYDIFRFNTFLEIKGIVQGFYDLCNKKIIFKDKFKGISLKYDKILEEIDFGSDIYRDVIMEINNTYKFGFFTSMYILIRKLLENLIYDCLKKHYGTANIEKFFNESKTKHHGFSTLRLNFNALIQEPGFIAMVGSVDQKIIDLLGEFKEKGNINAHSLFNFPHQSFVEEKKEEIDLLLSRLKNILENS